MAYVTYTLAASPQGSFQGLAEEGAIELLQQFGASQLVLIQRWVYLAGNYPKAHARFLQIEAQGTKIVIHTIPDEDYPDYQVVRVILLEGAAVNVSKLDGTDTHQLTNANTYLDARVRNDGYISNWYGPSSFDRDTTQGSEGIMDEVDAARDEMEIP